MAKLPLKLIQDLFLQICVREDWSGTAKKGSYVLEGWGQRVELYHYGTLIFTVHRGAGTEIGTGGWSASDRDAINSLLSLMGNTHERVCVRGGNIRYV